MAKTKLYQCIGENYIDGVHLGYCGDTHPLNEWLEILFPGKNAVEYFEGFRDSAVLDYIYKTKGKRLMKA